MKSLHLGAPEPPPPETGQAVLGERRLPPGLFPSAHTCVLAPPMKTKHEPPLEPQSPFLRTIRSSVCLLVSVLRSHPSRHQLHQAVTTRPQPPALQDAKPQAQASVQILLRIVDPRDPLRSPHQGQDARRFLPGRAASWGLSGLASSFPGPASGPELAGDPCSARSRGCWS